MSDDIVKWLRQARADMLGTADEQHYHDCHEAADEIERLRAELAVERERTERLAARLTVSAATIGARWDEIDAERDELLAKVEHDLADMRLRAEHAEAERDALRAALSYVRKRVERIKYLAGLDEPVQEQANMAMDAIDAALNKGGGDE